MELRHQLTPHLTKLRLSGILQTLEARNRQTYPVRRPGSRKGGQPAGDNASGPHVRPHGDGTARALVRRCSAPTPH